MAEIEVPNPNKQSWFTVRTALSIIAALLLFFFAIDLMVSSLQKLSEGAAEAILLATSNPFTALFIGLLIIALIQSSSTSTALVVAFVASGAISLENAVPIIMGANIGTTITSTIISLGFISKPKEFKRAVSAGTYHDFFNILTVLVLFPLEYYYGFLSGLSSYISQALFTPSNTANPVSDTHVGLGFGGIVHWLVTSISNGFILIPMAFALLLGSILLFRKLISDLLLIKSPEKLSLFFFKNDLKAFGWGMVITGAIRSSTITTSLVVPLVAKRIVKLKAAVPFILGANIGTTVTAFIAAILYASNSSAITIAIAHFLFNFIGVVLFFPIPTLRKIPIDLASFLGKLTLRYRMAGFVYLLLTFFIIPFSLIYLNKNSFSTTTVVYVTSRKDSNHKDLNKFILRINNTTKSGQWVEFANEDSGSSSVSNKIQNIYYRDKVLFVEDQMLMFSKPGFCWDGEDLRGKYQICVDSILNDFIINTQTSVDSVYVFNTTYYADSVGRSSKIYLSPMLPLILKKVEYDSSGLLELKRVLSLEND